LLNRSPTRPNYKEEQYKQSTITLRYVGHPDHRYQRVSKKVKVPESIEED
jgi:hypothetical protein